MSGQIKNIEEQLKKLGIDIKGSLNMEEDFQDNGKVKIYDMNITTFKRKLVGVYYKNLNTVFTAESLGLI